MSWVFYWENLGTEKGMGRWEPSEGDWDEQGFTADRLGHLRNSKVLGEGSLDTSVKGRQVKLGDPFPSRAGSSFLELATATGSHWALGTFLSLIFQL